MQLFTSPNTIAPTQQTVLMIVVKAVVKANSNENNRDLLSNYIKCCKQ